MRIAIIGSGVSGLIAAHCLSPDHDLTIFEAAGHVGGHAHTVDIELDGHHFAIDTGFIVYNERNYPLFTGMLKQLGVSSQPSAMSFSMRCQRTGLEYSGSSLNRLFAQRGNLLRPDFYRMLAGILRIKRLAESLLESSDRTSLGEFLAWRGISGPVVDDYLLPMAGAIWSSDPAAMLDFPARHFGRFFQNHGLLELVDRPQWRTVTGGSRQYVRELARRFRDRIRLRTPVQWVRRLPDQVAVKTRHERATSYDAVVSACHSDQALRLLCDPTPSESDILGAIPYRRNDAVLHTDERLLPRRRLARAAWNYHRLVGGGGQVTVTYNLTTLQRLPTKRQVLVTLNAPDAIDPARVIRRMTYFHPVYNSASMAAQTRWAEINGPNRTFFCGAYWGYGFHEDGVRSGFAVARAINGQGIDAQLHIRRVS